MTVKIVFCNRRGGVGKTLTAYNVAYDLAKLHNKKVLLIDGDPQKSLSFIAGANLESNVQLYSAVLIKDLAGNIQRGKYLDIVAGSDRLAMAKIGTQTFIDLFKDIPPEYDIAVIDTQPASNDLTLSLIAAADFVFIPTTAEYLALMGVVKSLTALNVMMDNGNGLPLQIGGMILTALEGHGTLYKQLADLAKDIANQNKVKLLEPAIRKGIAAPESIAIQEPLLVHAPNSKPCLDYQELTNNIYKIIRKGTKK